MAAEMSQLHHEMASQKTRFDALRDEHAPCAFALKVRDEEIQRLTLANKQQEAALESHQQMLQSANAKADALREAHATCGADLSARDADIDALQVLPKEP